MHELPLKWKLFRVLCILQMILAGFHGALWIHSLLRANGGILAILGISVFGTMLYYLYMGLSIINYNFPDTPLSPRQKKRFNLLFILNFLSIAFVFGTIVSEWRSSRDLLNFIRPHNATGYFFALLFFMVALILFVFHLIFLWGMIYMRREIYRNTEEVWQKQFGENEIK